MTGDYNLKNIRALLSEGFTDEELRCLCYDEPIFRSIYRQFDSNTSKAQVIRLLTKHVDQTSQIDTLLTLAKAQSPPIYEKYKPYYGIQRIQIYLQGDFSSLPTDRRVAALEAFAALMKIPLQEIEVFRIERGSIVFDLGIPPAAVRRLRVLLQSNNSQLRLLKVEKVILSNDSGQVEEWVLQQGKYDLIFSPHSTEDDNTDTRDTYRRLEKIMPKRKVTVKVTDAKNANVTTAGGSVVDNAKPGTPLGSEGGDVEVDLKGIAGGTFVTAGGDVVRFSQIAGPLETLAELLTQNLTQQDQIEHVKELIADLKGQAEKPPEARNASKIKMLLDNVGTYLGLVSLAATQAEKAQALFETVKRFLMVSVTS